MALTFPVESEAAGFW